MAILAAVNSPEVDIIGITTIFGNVTTSQATKNAFILLNLAGRPDVSTNLGPTSLRALETLRATRILPRYLGVGKGLATPLRRCATLVDFVCLQEHCASLRPHIQKQMQSPLLGKSILGARFLSMRGGSHHVRPLMSWYTRFQTRSSASACNGVQTARQSFSSGKARAGSCLLLILRRRRVGGFK